MRAIIIAHSEIRSGKARPLSRNPAIAQGLSFLDRMEERGTGIQRMRDAMLDHGIDQPSIAVVDNEVVVALTGPGDDLDRIRIPERYSTGISPSIEAKLNDRQKAILEEIIMNGSITSGWCINNLKIVKDTAVRDLNELISYGLINPEGRGRGRHYVLKK